MNQEQQEEKLCICPVENKESCDEGCTEHCEPHEYISGECDADGMPACIPVAPEPKKAEGDDGIPMMEPVKQPEQEKCGTISKIISNNICKNCGKFVCCDDKPKGHHCELFKKTIWDIQYLLEKLLPNEKDLPKTNELDKIRIEKGTLHKVWNLGFNGARKYIELKIKEII